MAYGRQEPGEPFRRISAKEAYEMQQQGAIVVDVRRPDEWRTGYAKGAKLIQLDEFLSKAEQELPKDKDLLFICLAGSRSAVAAEMAAALEFDPKHLYNVEDGTPAWIDAGLPTDKP